MYKNPSLGFLIDKDQFTLSQVSAH